MGSDHKTIRHLERTLDTDITVWGTGGSTSEADSHQSLKSLEACSECTLLVDGEHSVIGLTIPSCDLQSVPIEVFALSSLLFLGLRSNSIQRIPGQVLQLKGLRAIQLSGNGMLSFPSILLELPAIERIHAGNNKFSTVPPSLFSKASLERVSLAGNHIITLPRAAAHSRLPVLLDESQKHSGISLAGNPLGSPPVEIVRRGRRAMKEYFYTSNSNISGRHEEDMQALSEVKLILVGAGGAGKTTLSRRLRGKTFNPDESKTPGINIDTIEIEAEDETTVVHVWDFGGQEIMHATHQFFLTDRSIYVLVLDGRKEESAEYWLKHVRSFGGGSPVLIVLNKIDENPGFDVNRRFLAQKYPSIVGFTSVSCKTGQGLKAFMGSLANAVGRVEIRHTRWPSSWFAVKESLTKLKKPFMSYGGYRRLCRRHGLKRERSQEVLATFLNDLGVVVHFNDFVLQDTHVLEPKWLTGAVYTILNSDDLALGEGVLSLRNLTRILEQSEPPYPASKHAYIFGVMEKFELCYQIGSDQLMVPNLLPVGEPEIDLDHDDALRFRVEYDFLPPSILPRLIVRRHESIKDNLRWRTGVVFDDALFNASALVRADMTARQVEILVEGEGARDLLTVLRAELRDLARSFRNLGATEMVPLSDNPGRAVSFEHLIKLEKIGQTSYFPDGAEHSYELSDLIGTVVVERTRTEEEFLEVLRRAVTDSDSEDAALDKANDILLLQPSFGGIGIDLRALIRKIRMR